MVKEELQQRFLSFFGEGPGDVHCYFAPGRVNVIGEHQDYNGGHVFPAALKVGIYGAIRLREDGKVRLHSDNMEKTVIVDVNEQFQYNIEHDWANYPLGVIQFLKDKGHTVPGMDIYYNGNLPAGAGLSSSACMLDLTGYMLLSELGLIPIDRTELAKMAMHVEYHFVGVKVGIMDMYAIAHGKEGHGVLLDCTKMERKLVPLNWHGYTLIIMNTNKQRGLVDSKFNERKGQCDAALEIVQKHKDVSGLSLATLEDLESITDDVLKRRARHVVTENIRVLDFMKALEAADLTGIAHCLNESHRSLQVDFEVTGKELDTIVNIARAQEGCIASRMTGAGFGGCAIALVEDEHVEAFMRALPEEYEKQIGVTPSLYIADIGDGVYSM